jgi:transposase
MTTSRKPYPSDVSDEEWALAAPYLTLLPEDAGQRTHRLREVFDGLRYSVRYGVPWRALPNDLPPWHAVHDQAQRWLRAGSFEMLAHDLRAALRLARVCGAWARGEIRVIYQWLRIWWSCAHIYTCMPT